MTAYARIITTGRNDEMPRMVRLPVGVRVDGTEVTSLVRLMADEIPCPDCNGRGEINCSSNNPSVKDWTERCERCDGGAIITVEPDEEHTTARCLGAVVSGPSAVGPAAGGPPNSGMKPGSLAAGDLPQFVGRKAHTAQRSVPGLSASRRPAGEMPPNALPGTLADRIIDAVTVIAGLSIFGIVALFLMVLA
jgi:hypothetical protein